MLLHFCFSDDVVPYPESGYPRVMLMSERYRLYQNMFVKQEYNRKLLPRVHSGTPVDVDLEFELNTVSGLVSSFVTSFINVLQNIFKVFFLTRMK